MARHSFQIHVPDIELDDLRQRLGNTRLPQAPAGEPWESGVDYGYLRDLVDYWRSDFDWRHQEDRLNAFPQYMSVIEGLARWVLELVAGSARRHGARYGVTANPLFAIVS